MKLTKIAICLVLALSMLALCACGSGGIQDFNGAETSPSASPAAEETPAAEESPAAAEESPAAEEPAFSYSDSLDENGHWQDVKALELVTLPEYESITIPADTHTISDDAVQTEVDAILANHVTYNEIKDRAVADGDTLNIDYDGFIDDVAIENGSTNGAGTEVTVGVTSYIDDFIDQLKGHTPGETFDIDVTFPDPYPNNEDYSGKDAKFTVTINYIKETVTPELTDEFVSENLSESYGWMTAQEARDALRADLKDSAIRSYLKEYLVSNSTVTSVPQSLTDYQDGALIQYFTQYAGYYGMELDDFLTQYAGFESREALIELYAEDNLKAATLNLVIQAVAEDMGLTITEDDVTAFFKDNMGLDDYSEYETYYGRPYLMQTILSETVLDSLAETAVLG